MPKVNVLNTEGKKAGTITLSDDIFSVEISQAAMHMMVKNYLANQRQGTQSTLTRTEVRGGGRKPWRQKGTGRARQGSIRSPQWRGGGVALGPKPRKYNFSVNKKLRRLAMKSALTTKLAENELVVIDAFNLEEVKTKNMATILENLQAPGALIVTAAKDENVVLSARNIPGVKTTLVTTLNVYDILKYEKFIVTKDAVKAISEVYA